MFSVLPRTQNIPSYLKIEVQWLGGRVFERVVARLRGGGGLSIMGSTLLCP